MEFKRLPNRWTNIVTILDQSRKGNHSFTYCEIPKNVVVENLKIIKPNKSVLEIHNFKEALNFYDIKCDEIDFNVENVPELCTKLKININLYVKEGNKVVSFFEPLAQEYSQTVNLLIENENSNNIKLIANSNFLPKIYRCMVTEKCCYHTTKETNYIEHIATCKKTSTQKIETIMRSYGTDPTPLMEMIEEGILPPEAQFYRQKYFCTWDIETLEQPKDIEPDFDQSYLDSCEGGSALKYVAKCRIASIAVGSNFPGYETKTFARKDSTPNSSVILIKQFFKCLDSLHKEIVKTIPEYIFDAQAHIEEVEGGFNRYKTKYFTWQNFLKSFTDLSIFGFNSSKFDMPCLAPLIFSMAKRKGYKINCIKRGTRYLNVTIGDFSFRDILMLSSPCKLSDYLKTWKTSECKSIFPYQKYKSIEQLENDTTFPPIEDFYSSLSNEQTPIELYNREKAKYYKMVSEKKIKNMKGWLVYYNKLDVAPLSEAIENQFSAFDKLFGQDLITFFSLPSVAERICYTNFDEKSPLVWSFHEDTYRTDFRSNIIGGLTNVMHRMINTRDDSGPFNSRHAPDGSKFSHFMFLDFNSLYLWVG